MSDALVPSEMSETINSDRHVPCPTPVRKVQYLYFSNTFLQSPAGIISYQVKKISNLEDATYLIHLEKKKQMFLQNLLRI